MQVPGQKHGRADSLRLGRLGGLRCHDLCDASMGPSSLAPSLAAPVTAAPPTGADSKLRVRLRRHVEGANSVDVWRRGEIGKELRRIASVENWSVV